MPNEVRIMINMHIEINEVACDYKVHDGEKYKFSPLLDEKEKIYEDYQEPIVISPPIRMNLTSHSSEAQVVTFYQVHQER